MKSTFNQIAATQLADRLIDECDGSYSASAAYMIRDMQSVIHDQALELERLSRELNDLRQYKRDVINAKIEGHIGELRKINSTEYTH